MASVLDTISRVAGRMRDAADRGANAIFDTGLRHLNPEMQRAREEKIQIFEIAKVAALVTVCSAIFFTAVFPSIFSILLLGTAAFSSYESYTACSNILEILRNIRVNINARSTREELIHQIAKNTFTIKSIISALNPSYEQLLELTGWDTRL